MTTHPGDKARIARAIHRGDSLLAGVADAAWKEIGNGIAMISMPWSDALVGDPKDRRDPWRCGLGLDGHLRRRRRDVPPPRPSRAPPPSTCASTTCAPPPRASASPRGPNATMSPAPSLSSGPRPGTRTGAAPSPPPPAPSPSSAPGRGARDDPSPPRTRRRHQAAPRPARWRRWWRPCPISAFSASPSTAAATS